MFESSVKRVPVSGNGNELFEMEFSDNLNVNNAVAQLKSDANDLSHNSSHNNNYNTNNKSQKLSTIKFTSNGNEYNDTQNKLSLNIDDSFQNFMKDLADDSNAAIANNHNNNSIPNNLNFSKHLAANNSYNINAFLASKGAILLSALQQNLNNSISNKSQVIVNPLKASGQPVTPNHDY